jgi:hypothetical protein
MSQPVEAFIVHKFSVRNSNNKQSVILHLVCGEQEFDFALIPEAADNLRAGLDKAVSLIQHQSGHPKQ